ncbi:MAG: hypothetical protein J6P57_06200, partial [Lachnospiraceae bacterium]|nr:hypothetical protein [Lachnospiraceae bacterium]
MDKWIILGIKKTKDEDEVKAAYRKKLAGVNPEDDPEGFMELRKAYEDAIYEINHSDDESYDDAEIGSGKKGNKDDEIKDELVKKMSDIYHNFKRRINPNEWEKLFETDDFVSLETS